MAIGVPSVWPSKTPERISQLVGLVARGDDLALPGAAAVEFGLDVGLGSGECGRAAVDDDADAAAVGFAEGGDAEDVAEAARHGRRGL